jgi:hypothetical protein
MCAKGEVSCCVLSDTDDMIGKLRMMLDSVKTNVEVAWFAMEMSVRDSIKSGRGELLIYESVHFNPIMRDTYTAVAYFAAPSSPSSSLSPRFHVIRSFSARNQNAGHLAFKNVSVEAESLKPVDNPGSAVSHHHHWGSVRKARIVPRSVRMHRVVISHDLNPSFTLLILA